MMPRWKICGWVLLLLAGVWGSGCTLAPRTAPVPVALSAEERAALNLRVFDRVWELVNEKFFDAKFRGVDWPAMRTRYRPEAEKAKDDEMLYAVVNRMLSELKESHNYAMTPQVKFETQTHQRARVGLGFLRVEGKWVVTEVTPGSPADEAGVKAGWLVLRRGGRSLDGAPFTPPKTGVPMEYEFLDEHDQPRVLTLVAREISTANRTEVRELAGGVVYLRFDGFDLKSRRWLREQMKARAAAPAMVIDLRRNHGGLFFSLETILAEFFPRSVAFGSFVRRSGSEREKDTLGFFSTRYAGRVALLIDEPTASCAEIFAHAMQHHRRAVLVGRKTSGAVVVALYYSLPGGGQLQLAIEDFRGLDGKRLEGVGVVPDTVVPRRLADVRARRDADLEAALDQLASFEGVRLTNP